MGIVAYLLFFLAGVGFGYAAPGRLVMVLRLLLALVLTAAGILAGRELDERGRRRHGAAAA